MWILSKYFKAPDAVPEGSRIQKLLILVGLRSFCLPSSYILDSCQPKQKQGLRARKCLLGSSICEFRVLQDQLKRGLTDARLLVMKHALHVQCGVADTFNKASGMKKDPLSAGGTLNDLGSRRRPVFISSRRLSSTEMRGFSVRLRRISEEPVS